MRKAWAIVFVVGLGVLAALSGPPFWAQRAGLSSANADDSAKKSAPPKAVEEDMHEFMEYLFQPAYLRLKAQMAAEPTSNQGWKTIKAEALILAEGGNLLLMRQPDDGDEADWAKHSVATRESGSQLYAAGRKKDFQAARKHYEAMLAKCNACHDQFAGGEHQLTP